MVFLLGMMFCLLRRKSHANLTTAYNDYKGILARTMRAKHPSPGLMERKSIVLRTGKKEHLRFPCLGILACVVAHHSITIALPTIIIF